MSESPYGTAHLLQEAFFESMGGPQQVQHLFAHLPDVYFFLKDAQSRMMGAGATILNRLGVSTESEIIGTTDHDHFPTQLADEFVRDDRAMIESGRPLINRVEIWYTEDSVNVTGSCHGSDSNTKRQQPYESSPPVH